LQRLHCLILIITKENKNKKGKERKKERKDASKFQAKICMKDSNGSIFGNDVNVIYLSNNVMLIKTTVKDLRDVQ
jgi:hypothetical protein